MKRSFIYTGIILMSSLVGTQCSSDDVQQETLTRYSFDNTMDGWIGEFADYPVNGDGFYQLSWSLNALPEELGKLNGLKVRFTNYSDDVFAYLSKEISSLNPNAVQTIKVEVKIATPYSFDIGGIGGSPGESNAVKIGVVNSVPARVVKVEAGDNLYWRTSFDKGNQGVGGKDMVVTGTLYNGVRSDNLSWQIISQTATFSMKPDSNGRVWVLFGIDSGFEGITEVFIDEISVSISN